MDILVEDDPGNFFEAGIDAGQGSHRRHFPA
jgi:hypothetical protein